MRVVPESPGEHDLLIARLKAFQHLLGAAVPLSIQPEGYHLIQVKAPDPLTTDQIP